MHDIDKHTATPWGRVFLAIFMAAYHKAYCNNNGIPSDTPESLAETWLTGATKPSFVDLAINLTRRSLKQGRPPVLCGPFRGFRLTDSNMVGTRVPVTH